MGFFWILGVIFVVIKNRFRREKDFSRFETPRKICKCLGKMLNIFFFFF